MFWIVALAAAAVGTVGAWHYAEAGLTLSHYDARGHLIVARRVFDNLMPGWMQLGAVWLPLPHVLNAPAVQWDWSYQTGASGTALSILTLSAGLGALARLIGERTGSPVTGACAAFAILLNPNVFYLQATPMTEPLLFGSSGLALLAVDRFLEHPTPRATQLAGASMAALVLTRYEGWAITGALAGLVLLAHPRRAVQALAWPAAAVVLFLLLSYGSTGQWFTTGGFFEATNPALGRPVLAARQVIDGAVSLSSRWLMLAAAVAGVALLARAGLQRLGRIDLSRTLLPLTLFAAAALPMYAFTSGHPVRVRYMIALVVACTAASATLLQWLPKRVRAGAAMALLGLLLVGSPPLGPEAPMVQEAQWERPYAAARESVTRALAAVWDGTPVMASMGSLGHYMQQMASSGFALRHFLHEGNGEVWKAALVSPAPYVRWILIEEAAEGGDVIAQRARATPGYLDAFERLSDGGGVALYRRVRTESGTRR